MNLHPQLYSFLIDPRLAGVRERIIKHIPGKSRVIDIACGTGALSHQLALKGHIVTGLDISASMIDYASKKAFESGLYNLTYLEADASDISDIPDKSFDYSVMSLALHQFSDDNRKLVLNEAMRVSKTLIIADYAYPQPKGFYGKMIRIIERVAGKEHFASFKSYLKSGGMNSLSILNGSTINTDETFGKGIFVLGICS